MNADFYTRRAWFAVDLNGIGYDMQTYAARRANTYPFVVKFVVVGFLNEVFLDQKERFRIKQGIRIKAVVKDFDPEVGLCVDL